MFLETTYHERLPKVYRNLMLQCFQSFDRFEVLWIENKKALPINQKSFDIFCLRISKLLSDLSFSENFGVGVGTFFRLRGTGCQGFTGPFPSAFLDK
jgi:hypothetical protein